MFEYLKEIGKGRDGINTFATGLFNSLPVEQNEDYSIFKSIETHCNTDFKENQYAKITYSMSNYKTDEEKGIVIEIYPKEIDELETCRRRALNEKVSEILDKVKDDKNISDDIKCD